MSAIATRVPALAVLLALALVGAPARSEVTTTVLVRDAVDGRGLAATIEVAALATPVPPTVVALTEAVDQARLAGATRRYHGARSSVPLAGATVARISLAGYRTLHAVLEPGASAASWTLWLARDQAADETGFEDRHGQVSGHVIDPTTLAPVVGARVALAGMPDSAVTDHRGRFQLQVPVMDGRMALEQARLLVRAPDGRRLERSIALAPGADLHLMIDLDPAYADQPGHRHLLAPAQAQRPEAPVPGGLAPQLVPLGTGLAPPASIRVGFADAGCNATCCTGNCSHVCVFDLENYVRRGLNDEWIASWSTQALRAGAIAYRSYGAWHAFNPHPTRPYDLCSSACCQVNDADTSSSTNLATARTAGLMLERNGAVFRSEYSAENNCLLGQMSCANSDLSCGNGFAGSPAAGWPCLADPVGLDRACFGHGRGMSQWGTQRWSLAPHGRTWRWQVDHYYNGHGAGSGLRTAVTSQVLVLESVRARQRTVAVGQPLLLDFTGSNLAAEAHPWVLLGASLRRPPGGFIDDPDNDLAVTLVPGQSAVSRGFQTPPTLPAGRYDLYGALYLDVDEDGAIASGDLVQDLVMVVQAVRLVAADDLIFADGWQTLP